MEETSLLVVEFFADVILSLSSHRFVRFINIGFNIDFE